ncbi:cytochrome P450 [Kitasatospora sp. NPDC048296]|jgi:pentalenic acid synthase|uniref:cytochrome P450 n=1 Tax=Kitasatospora sp. NPDC048296 TaxID=3364048 RepID=UPI0037166E4E
MTVTPTGSRSSEAPAYPMARGCPYRMPDGYEQLRADGPVSRVTLYDGRNVWLVSGSAEGRALLLDPRVSVDVRHPSFPALTPQSAEQAEAGFAPPLSGVDDPEHAHQRRMVIPAFGVRRIAALRPRIEGFAEELVDAMLARGDRADLVAAYSLPLACAANFALLGVPEDDGRYIAERTRQVLAPADGNAPGEAGKLFGEILTRLRDLVARKERQPGTGLIDDLLAARPDEGGMDGDQLVALCAILLTGGDDTTSSTIAAATLALLEHPDQLEKLRREPELTPGAVDELTRLTSVADVLPRVATADIELAGHTIQDGDGVLVSLMLMNRDPGTWQEPDALDIHRKAGRHVAFGYGIHQCVGQNLARAVIETALTVLLRRVPTLRLAVPADQVRANPPYVLQGSLSALPVAW